MREDDAEFIVALRTNERLGQHLSQTKPDVEAQKRWITAYKDRESASQEFYFVIVHDGEDVGVVRLYDFRDGSFCWGSWIIKPGSPSACSIASALLVYETAFTQLGFEASHFDVRRENTRVWSFHERMGAVKVGESDIDFFYALSADQYEIAKEKFARYAP